MRLLIIITLLTVYSCVRGQVTKLETRLILSGQKITTIPDSIFDKTDLLYLDLGSSDVVFHPPLSALVDTNANKISELPDKIDKLKNLKTLILNSNQLKTLPNSISNLTNLEVLDLSINKELDILNELGKIKKMRHLKVLKIVDVKAIEDDVETIKKALPNTKIILTISDYFESLKQ